jgi:hypothetical protein
MMRRQVLMYPNSIKPTGMRFSDDAESHCESAQCIVADQTPNIQHPETMTFH